MIGWQEGPGEELHSGAWSYDGVMSLLRGIGASRSPEPKSVLADITFQVTEKLTH